MGFLGGIGRAISSFARSSIGKLAINVGLGMLTGGASTLLSGGVSSIFGGLASKVMGSLGGSGGMLSGLLSKVTGFLGGGGASSLLGSGPLSMIKGVLGSLSGQGGGLGKIADFASGLLGKIGGAQNASGEGMNNITELLAQSAAKALQNKFGAALA